ncbi:MAG: AlwI family type II restriction endonuclease [Kiritimatiellae bacterium]|nr:AlwI family type II restriction endonuclease [Kiritimatiellia bacterium]
MDIWQIGNTGVRNPMRIQDALRVYAESPLIGKIRGVGGSIAFMDLLCEKHVLHNEPGKDDSGSYGRKFRFVFNANGFTYDVVSRKRGLLQEDFGCVDAITPFGKAFLEAETIPAVQECFLRASSVPMKPLSDGRTFSPLRWTLAILIEVGKRTGSADLSFIEFAVFVQTTDPSHDIESVVNRILKFRAGRKDAKAKKKFDANYYAGLKNEYCKNVKNFREYGDMNIRYLKATGIVRARGHGIALVTEKRTLAEKLAAVQVSNLPEADRLKALYKCPTLPTDDLDVAKEVLVETESLLESRHISFQIDHRRLVTPQDVNNARSKLEVLLAQDSEEIFAKEQKCKWSEIADYMDLVMHNGGKKVYDDEYGIEVPKEEASAYLEWSVWRAFLAMNTLHNKPYNVRRFKIDQDFLPVCTAPGNGPDLIAEYANTVVVIEVTLSTNSRQEAMEGEPVRRHVADLVTRYPGKNVYGLFIANKIDTNTAETFRNGVWYTKDDVKMNLNIVPFTLSQFKDYFVSLFKTGHYGHGEIVDLISACGDYRKHCDAPSWKTAISKGVLSAIVQNNEGNVAEFQNAHEDMLEAAGVAMPQAGDEFTLSQEASLMAD